MTGSDQIGDRDALRAAFMPLWQSNVSADMAFAWVEAQIRAALVAERALSDRLAADVEAAYTDSMALTAWRVARGGNQ